MNPASPPRARRGPAGETVRASMLPAPGLLVAAVWISPTLIFWSLVVLPLAAMPVLIAA
jgi:hypothetical protein